MNILSVSVGSIPNLLLLRAILTRGVTVTKGVSFVSVLYFCCHLCVCVCLCVCVAAHVRVLICSLCFFFSIQLCSMAQACLGDQIALVGVNDVYFSLQLT